MSSFLSESRPKHNKLVSKIFSKASDILSKTFVQKILLQNKYEELVPFNLWFKHDKYAIINHTQSNQNIRIRYFNNIILTPLVTQDNSLDKIKKLIPNMTLYQPFYPETFYSFWDFLQNKYLESVGTDFLFISKENSLGSLESLILQSEINNNDSLYDYWLAGDETKIFENYLLKTVPNDYLGQAYKLNYLRSTKFLRMYNFIYIDSLSTLDDVFEWSTEEIDYQATLFYFLFSLKYLQKGGSMVIRIRLAGSQSWYVLFDLAKKYFKEYTFYRSNIINPFNSEVYLLLNKFKTFTSISISEKVIQNLYIQKTYEKFYLNWEFDSTNSMSKDFDLFQGKWISNVNKCLSNIKNGVGSSCSGTNLINDWCNINKLAQIWELEDKLDQKPMRCKINTSTKNIKIRIDNDDMSLDLTKEKIKLNHFKRVMDTKPSNIFMPIRYTKDRGYLWTWEELSASIDPFSGLKYHLKNNFNAEMMTNAWIKMYEILKVYQNLIPIKPTVKTFHICEAPGGFVSATNHFVTTSDSNSKLEWYAQTLRPNDFEENNALDDHFGLICSNPDKWIFGDPSTDDTGDITHSSVIKYYAKHEKLKDIDFITADAGIRCNPQELNDQEEKLAKLNMGQIVCILACLPIGKSAIFKTFIPMAEPLTISLIYLLSHLFNSVEIFKPSTSHSSNSEVYVVLQDYKGIDKDLLEILYVLLDDPKISSKSVLFDKYNKDFVKSYSNGIRSMIDRQIKSLVRSYYYYYHPDQISNIVKLSKEWIEHHRIKPLTSPLIKSHDADLEALV